MAPLCCLIKDPLVACPSRAKSCVLDSHCAQPRCPQRSLSPHIFLIPLLLIMFPPALTTSIHHAHLLWSEFEVIFQRVKCNLLHNNHPNFLSNNIDYFLFCLLDYWYFMWYHLFHTKSTGNEYNSPHFLRCLPEIHILSKLVSLNSHLRFFYLQTTVVYHNA